MIRYFTLFALICGVSAAESISTNLIKELEPLRPLLKTWKGQFVGGKTNTPPTVDVVRFERALNGQAIRVIHSVNNGVYGGETLMIWNAPAKKIQFFYFTTAGFRTEGTIEVAPDGTMTSLEIVKGDAAKEGGEETSQARATTNILPDGRLHVKSEYLKKDGWKPGHEVFYKEDPTAEIVFK